MPFDRLPDKIGSIPEFRPISVTQLPEPSIWPGIAQGAAKGIGVLANALDPVEKAKRKLGLAQLQMQTKALEDYQKGNFKDDEFYIGPDGLPKRRTEEDMLDLAYKRWRIGKEKKNQEYSENARTSTFREYYQVPEPELPTGPGVDPNAPQFVTPEASSGRF